MILAGIRLRKKLNLESSKNFGTCSKKRMIRKNKTHLTIRVLKPLIRDLLSIKTLLVALRVKHLLDLIEIALILKKIGVW